MCQQGPAPCTLQKRDRFWVLTAARSVLLRDVGRGLCTTIRSYLDTILGTAAERAGQIGASVQERGRAVSGSADSDCSRVETNRHGVDRERKGRKEAKGVPRVPCYRHTRPPDAVAGGECHLKLDA